MKMIDFRFTLLAFCFLALPELLGASVLEVKSLTRDREAVVAAGSSMAGFYGRAVNSADATLSPNELFVWAYDSATGWRQVVFQIDEVNNTYPTRPGPDYYICNTTTWASRGGTGTNYFEADDGVWDLNDELVFMTAELGDRVSLDEWAPGASTDYPRYEIAVTDPLNTTQKGWAYGFVHTTLPAWTTASHMTWTEGTNFLQARDYTLQYATSDANAMAFTALSVTLALGGTGADLLEQQRLRTSVYYSGLGTNVSITESTMRTQFSLGCYSGDPSLQGDSPWLYKTGRVRVSRYYWTNPPEQWYYADDHTWKPVHFNRYYPTFWHEDQLMNHSCPTCAAEMNWYRDYLDHSNTLVFNFYTSNGDAVVINGSTETLASTPTWTWSQSSSVAGGFVKLYPPAYMALDSGSPSNYYLDDNTTNAEAGYLLNEPQHTSSTHHNFYYFMLPANVSNVGQQYRDWVNSPLTRTFASQAYVVPPQNFDGILFATDLNGACVDQGVEITWDNVLDWNDGCSASCTNRRFVVYRNSVKIRDEYNLTLSAWTDTTGTNSTTYNYGVEACNHSNICTALGNVLPGVDYVAAAPVLASTATTAADHDACTADGIDLSWADPSDWRDNGEGARIFDLYWSDDAYAAPILTGVASPLLYAVADGDSHQYRIRAVNGCDLFTNYAASAATTDQVGADPTLPANPLVTVTDLDFCSFTGVAVAWNAIDAWGDNGTGSRRYDLYWSRDGFTAPIAANATSPATIHPPDSNPTTYRVIATSGCDRTALYTDGIGADGQTAPLFAGVQSVTDTDGCAVSTVTVAWVDVNGDGPEGWNDGGSGAGPRIYRIFRDGAPIGEVPDGTASFTDTPPAPNTVYAYVVQAVNMDGCYTAGAGAVSGTDLAGVVPAATPGQTTASDECGRGESPAQGVAIVWDAPAAWGDHDVNAEGRRFYLYYSGNNFSTAIAAVPGVTTSLTYNPPDNIPYIYRITARNGCFKTLNYAASAPVFDKTSCSPSCTIVLEENFNSTNSFAQICSNENFWNLTDGAGNGGTRAWRANLDINNAKNGYARLRRSSAMNLLWSADVKLRFWSSVNLASDDAGIVEIWTDDSASWKKIELLPYPSLSAVVPDSIATGTGDCATDAVGGSQLAFQGTWAGAFYEVRLDPYLNLSATTTQINIGFRVASGDTRQASAWAIDDVMIGYGIADGVWWWSLGGDLAAGVVKSGTEEAVFSWEDGGLYVDDEFRIYRSDNPAAIRTDPSSSLIHTEPDTDALSYSWTTTDGIPAAGTCWFYKVYGYKEPCGESNQGEN